jgi:phosphoribosylformimino-5-aminoimidazole carboxamide ribotide isomerase
VDRITPAAPVASVERGGRARVVGVIDLRGGRAVHARGGNRASYVPVSDAGGRVIHGDAGRLARVYVESLGVRELYVADLDAIEHGARAMQTGVIADIAASGAPIWVDAGAATVDDARQVLGTGASLVVVGSETLRDFGALGEICSDVGGSRVAFSLDLRRGIPLTPPNVEHAEASPSDLAARAANAGARQIIVLDLARVGTGTRIDLLLIAAIRAAVPDVGLFAAGGVRDSADLEALSGVGCDGVLVATALLSGALDA